MKAFHRHHSINSALKRVLVLLKGVGVIATTAVIIAEFGDVCLRLFDREYGVTTSGYMALRDTSFDPARLKDALAYRPVNAWAFRRFLNQLALPKNLRFADLGSGMGRPCIIAAEYGFCQVTGVDLAADLCVRARENLTACRGLLTSNSSLNIVHADVLDYCAHSEDDVFFMYRPFSVEIFRKVLGQLAEKASKQRKILTILYSQNVMQDSLYLDVFSQDPAYRKISYSSMVGFEFHVYQCGEGTRNSETARVLVPDDSRPSFKKGGAQT